MCMDRIEKRIFLRAPLKRGFQVRQVCAEGPRGAGAVQARRDLGACLRHEALLHRQLHAGGVTHAAVPLVDAAPVRALQRMRAAVRA